MWWRKKSASSIRCSGKIRAESELMYATSEGRILKLTRSKALDDYEAAAEKLKEVMKWR